MQSISVSSKLIEGIDPGGSLAACVNFFMDKYSLRKNIITGDVEDENKSIDGKYMVIDDREVNTIYLQLSNLKLRNPISKEFIFSFIESKYVDYYNPFIDFIEKNKNINRSEKLISDLAHTIESDTPIDNIEKYIKHWGCGMIASVFGSQSPLTLVLAGEQLNTGKTEFFRRLLPKELMSYYAESSLDGGKDDDILMCKKLIIMDDEFGGKSKQDQRHFKSMTSKQTMSIRLPYGRKTQEMRRLCSLCGTSNDVSLLNDPYGNRRILPINVFSIDHEKYNLINKTELFLAFYDLYKSGFHWKFTANDIKQLNDASEDFHAPNPEAELIDKYFCIPQTDNDGEYLTNTIIKDILETKTKQKIWNPTKLGLELVKLGFKRSRKNNQRVYYVKEHPVMAYNSAANNVKNISHPIEKEADLDLF